jgi:hypothetical protein
MIGQIFKDLFWDALVEVVYFPFWWYSQGLKKTGFFCWKKIKIGWHNLGLGVILRNFFKPMYGQRGFVAYFISIMVRFWQIIYLGFLMILWLIFWILVFALWIILPFFILWQLIVV